MTRGGSWSPEKKKKLAHKIGSPIQPNRANLIPNPNLTCLSSLLLHLHFARRLHQPPAWPPPPRAHRLAVVAPSPWLGCRHPSPPLSHCLGSVPPAADAACTSTGTGTSAGASSVDLHGFNLQQVAEAFPHGAPSGIGDPRGSGTRKEFAPLEKLEPGRGLCFGEWGGDRGCLPSPDLPRCQPDVRSSRSLSCIYLFLIS